MSRSFPAIFARGGTSNGLVILRQGLPPEDQWDQVLPAAMGSPDPYGRQLNGMGSGVSSTSKICVVATSSRSDADIDFTFVQVGIRDGRLDMAGNCGNMISAVGPVCWDEGLVPDRERKLVGGWVDGGVGSGDRQEVHARGGKEDGKQDSETTEHTALVRIFNTNTSKVIHSRFKVAGSPPRFRADGVYEMDGVPGTGSPITLSFLDPSGAKTGKALPTGNAVDTLTLPDGSTIEASLVDVSNPGVFIRVSDLGLADARTLDPPRVEADAALKARLEAIRQAGAARMGLDPRVESVPKIVLIFPPELKQPGTDLRCLALSMGQAHKAAPLTLGLCLGAAVRMDGTIPNWLATGSWEDGRSVVIGHPSGKIDIGATVEKGRIVSAELLRTARVLMKGDVFY